VPDTKDAATKSRWLSPLDQSQVRQLALGPFVPTIAANASRDLHLCSARRPCVQCVQLGTDESRSFALEREPRRLKGSGYRYALVDARREAEDAQKRLTARVTGVAPTAVHLRPRTYCMWKCIEVSHNNNRSARGGQDMGILLRIAF
jgi:hypothetical protein